MSGRSILFNDIAEDGDHYYNAARLLTPRGLAGAPYRKVHLVPFGEYVPLPRLFFFVRQISTDVDARDLEVPRVRALRIRGERDHVAEGEVLGREQLARHQDRGRARGRHRRGQDGGPGGDEDPNGEE